MPYVVQMLCLSRKRNENTKLLQLSARARCSPSSHSANRDDAACRAIIEWPENDYISSRSSRGSIYRENGRSMLRELHVAAPYFLWLVLGTGSHCGERFFLLVLAS